MNKLFQNASFQNNSLKRHIINYNMFYWVISAGLFGFFLNTDYCSQTCLIVKNSYNKISELRKIKKNLNLVITFKMFFIICWLIWSSARMMLSQWLNNNVVQIGKNRYIVTVTIGGKRYSTIIKHSVGPSPVLQVVDTKDNDITTNVEPFILFNSESVTPGDLGYDALSVMKHDGTDNDYNKNDIIRL